MDKTEIILYLYYDQHKKQAEIAEAVDSSQQYVSKVIIKDERYSMEKENRRVINKEKRKIDQKEYHENYVRPKKCDEEYEQMLFRQKQNSIAMSHKGSNMSDYTYAKWNPSIYRSNGKRTIEND